MLAQGIERVFEVRHFVAQLALFSIGQPPFGGELLDRLKHSMSGLIISNPPVRVGGCFRSDTCQSETRVQVVVQEIESRVGKIQNPGVKLCRHLLEAIKQFLRHPDLLVALLIEALSLPRQAVHCVIEGPRSRHMAMRGPP